MPLQQRLSSLWRHAPGGTVWERSLWVVRLAVKRFFLPDGYPHSVTPDYVRYQSWVVAQSSLGSAAYVLSTHSMLTAVGVSASAALPAAAAISWVLKDGLGCLGIMIAANRFGAAFDRNLKQSKWIGDILMVTGSSLEMATHCFPGAFLLLASVANTAKGIGGLSGGAAKVSINKGFCLRENLSDVTAKAFSQGIAAYLMGMGAGIGLSIALNGTSTTAVMACFAAIVAANVGCSYAALGSATLRTLDMQRSHILAIHPDTTWAEGLPASTLPSGLRVASPEAVSQRERFVYPVARPRPWLSLGCDLRAGLGPVLHAADGAPTWRELERVFANEKYVIGFPDTVNTRVLPVLLKEGATPHDHWRALHHAMRLYALMRRGRNDEGRGGSETHGWWVQQVRTSGIASWGCHEEWLTRVKDVGWHVDALLMPVGPYRLRTQDDKVVV